MLTAMRRLDAAYVVYRKRMDQTPAAASEAAATLEADIAEATANPAWS